MADKPVSTRQGRPRPPTKPTEPPSTHRVWLPLVLVAVVFFGAGFLWGTRFHSGRQPPTAGRDSPLRPGIAISGPVSPGPDPRPVADDPLAATLPPADSLRLPAEFEPQDAILLGCNELIHFHPETLVQMVSALHGAVRIIGLIENADEETKVRSLLAEHGLPPGAMQLIQVPLSSMWIRDFGPIFVEDFRGGRRLLDTDYVHQDRPLDDAMPEALAPLLSLARTRVPLALEGGNLLSNGRGLCLTTAALTNWNVARGYNVQQIGTVLRHFFGIKHWIYIRPLLGEPSGHIDMFLTLVAPDLAVLGRLDPKVDSYNARVLDESAQTLAGKQTAIGPLRVERVTMPSNRDGVWRSYTNVIFANGVLLVPTYPDVAPELDAEALALYRRLLPDWKVVGIDASQLAPKRGALHCVSIHVPRARPPSQAAL